MLAAGDYSLRPVIAGENMEELSEAQGDGAQRGHTWGTHR